MIKYIISNNYIKLFKMNGFAISIISGEINFIVIINGSLINFLN